MHTGGKKLTGGKHLRVYAYYQYYMYISYDENNGAKLR